MEGEGEGEGSGSEASEEEQSNASQLQEDAILVVATLIITLTYQAMAHPPSTFFKDGTAVEGGCLRLGLIFGRISPNHLKDCPALLAFWFLLLNTMIFLTSIIIVVSTFRGQRTIHLQLLMLYFVLCHTLLTAVNYNIISYAFTVGIIMIVAFDFFEIVTTLKSMQ